MNYKLPAVRVVGLVVAGILIGEYSYIPVKYFFYLCCTLSFVAVILYKKRDTLLYSILLQILLIFSTSLHHRITTEDTFRQRLVPFQDEEPIGLYGTIYTTPKIYEKYVRCLIKVDSVKQLGWFGGAPKIVSVYGDKKVFDTLQYVRGKHVYIYGRILEFPKERNPGENNYARFLESSEIDGIIRVDSSFLLSTQKNDFFSNSVLSIQNHLYSIFDQFHSERVSAFLKSLVLGNRSYLARDIKDSFVETGTIHILAVSGTHVGIVSLIFYTLFSVLRFSRKSICITSVVALLFYMVLTGMSPSVVRATIMATIILVGMCLERRTNIYNSLAVAALILLLANTKNLFSIGAQLSFAAVLSIVYFYPKLTQWINNIPENSFIDYIFKPLYKLFAVSLAAQIGTIPFTAYYFERISLISFVANIAVVPAAGFIIVIGFIEIFFSHFSVVVASLYAEVNEIAVQLLLWLVQTAASVPYASIKLQKVELLNVLLYFVVVLEISMPKRFLKYTIIVLLICANIQVYSLLYDEWHNSSEAVFFDVGQGDACLITFPNGSRALIDTGPRYGLSDAGKRVIVPYFEKEGIKRLNYVVLTHPHDDHTGGMLSISETISIDTLVIPDYAGYSDIFLSFIEEIIKRGIAVKRVTCGDQLFPYNGARVYVLHPQKNTTSIKNLNNISVILKTVYRNFSILLTGDAEKEVEQIVSNRYQSFLKADILKAGHHGSNTSSSEVFIESVNPNLVVISVGKKNKYNHPSEEVIERFQKKNIRIHRTDSERALLIKSNGNDWKTIDWSN